MPLIRLQNTMQELTTLMETHVDHNSRLREENNKMASQMTILLSQYEEKEGGSNAKTQERILELKLLEAQLAKAKIEKAGKSTKKIYYLCQMKHF